MFNLNDSPKGGGTVLRSFLVVLVILRGYAVVYPYALDFVVTRPIIPIGDQRSVATFLTVIFQCLPKIMGSEPPPSRRTFY